MARARGPHDAVVQYCLEYLGSLHPDFDLDGSTQSIFSSRVCVRKLRHACVAYASVNLDGQVGIVAFSSMLRVSKVS